MITKKETARPAFFSRFMILPLFFVLFCAFATTLHEQTPAVKTLSSKPFTIVIDAGHGGLDPGAISTSGVNEKDITLAIARKIEQLGPAYQIQVLMTREGDQLPGNTNTIHDGLRYRTDFANQHHADLFISIHVNAGTGYADKGMTIYLSEQNPFFNKSRSLGSSIIEEMKNTYSTNMEMRKRAEPIWVLKGTAMPAILMLCGNIDVPADLSFISDEHNQENIAKSVLQGVVHFEQHTADH
jgi:N-acetylmuramoyl-L-alanine amidase